MKIKPCVHPPEPIIWMEQTGMDFVNLYFQRSAGAEIYYLMQLNNEQIILTRELWDAGLRIRMPNYGVLAMDGKIYHGPYDKEDE